MMAAKARRAAGLMEKATAVAHPNIAFVKYWGKSDEALNLPANPSLSMNLAALATVTTVEFRPDLARHLLRLPAHQLVRRADDHLVAVCLLIDDR